VGNLLTKTLFVSLLSSVVISSGAQEGFFIKELAKKVLRAVVVTVVGTAVGVKIVKKSGKTVAKKATGGVIVLGAMVAGGAVAAVVREGILVGVGTAVVATAGVVAGATIGIKLKGDKEVVMGTVAGATIGAVAGEEMLKIIKKKIFQKKNCKRRSNREHRPEQKKTAQFKYVNFSQQNN